MKPHRFVILGIDQSGRWSGWREGDDRPLELARCDAPASEDPQGPAPARIAATIAEALRSEGYGGTGLVLTVPSSWCLCAAISTQGLPRRTRREQAMLYRLEEKLPLAAEDVAADFVEAQDTALGVAIRLDRVRTWVESLERAGVTIQTVLPLALLATQAVVEAGVAVSSSQEAGQPAPSGADAEPASVDAQSAAAGVYLWTQGNGLDVVLVKEVPIAWQCVAPEDLTLHLRRHAMITGSPLRVIVGCQSDVPPSAPQGLPGVTWVVKRDASVDAAAARGASALLAGDLEPWIDLRRGPLGAADPLRQVRPPLTVTLALTGVFLLVLSAGMLWRASRYGLLAGELADRQRAVFRETLPGQSVPAAVRSRLASETQRLRGLSDATGLESGRSALLLLRDALSRLPGDVRLRVLEIRVEKDRLYLEGQTRTHGDADLIAAALRKQQVFQVEPPRTEQLAGQGVSFTITGTLVSPRQVARGGRP